MFRALMAILAAFDLEVLKLLNELGSSFSTYQGAGKPYKWGTTTHSELDKLISIMHGLVVKSTDGCSSDYGVIRCQA